MHPPSWCGGFILNKIRRILPTLMAAPFVKVTQKFAQIDGSKVPSTESRQEGTARFLAKILAKVTPWKKTETRGQFKNSTYI